MNTPKKTMDAGQTVFWMGADYNLNARVINGTMYKLLSAKKGYTLTHILSRRFGLKILWSRLNQNHTSWLMDNDGYNEFPSYGVNGLRPHLKAVVWGLNMKSRWYGTQKRPLDTLLNTCSNRPFLRLVGLKDGSASDIVKDFRNRRKWRAGQ